MTEEYKHTALPWFAQEHAKSGDLGYKDHYIEADGGYLICDEICSPHDAAFIDRACNSHYEMLEALKMALNHYKANNYHPDMPCVVIAQTAIAKAEGES